MSSDSNTAAAPGTTPTPSKPRVLLLSLEKQPWFDEMYASLLTTLKAKADVEEVVDPDGAKVVFGFTGWARPDVILATDAGLLAK
jgi:hypothetical protein